MKTRMSPTSSKASSVVMNVTLDATSFFLRASTASPQASSVPPMQKPSVFSLSAPETSLAASSAAMTPFST